MLNYANSIKRFDIDEVIRLERSIDFVTDTFADTTNKRGEEIDILNIGGITALMISCFIGHDIIVEKLLRTNVDIHACNDEGGTALMYSCAKGHSTIVDKLIERGVKINVCDKDGFTPLMYSSENGHDAISRKLIESKAKINVPDENGCTALTYQCISGISLNVDKLITLGANLDIRDGLMKTPFLHLCENGHFALVKWLMENGVNIKCCDIVLKTALIYACENGYHALFCELIKRDVYLDFTDREGKTALMYACGKGHYSIVKQLLSKGVNVNAYDVMMKTALMYSSENGHDIIVGQLIKKGVTINALDRYGKSALLYSQEYGHTKAADNLIKHGATFDVCDKYLKQAALDQQTVDDKDMVVQNTNGTQESASTSPTLTTSEEINSSAERCPDEQREDGLLYPSGCDPGEEVNYEPDIHYESAGRCEKNLDNFIPVLEFCMEHLPEHLQTEACFTAIKRRCDLTVKILVTYVSEERPEKDLNEKKYSFAHARGLYEPRTGTGLITNILMDKPRTDTPCPCGLCKITCDREKEWWEMTVCTATHVIFDNQEAKTATFQCFYDSDDKSGVKLLFGRAIQYSITRIDTMCRSDLCEVLCVTHDRELVERIRGVLGSDSPISCFSNQPSEVIVSHPYGSSKKISVGKILHLTVPIKPEYKTRKPFPFLNQTKCRLPCRPSESDESKTAPCDEKRKKKKKTLNAGDPRSSDQTPTPSGNTDGKTHLNAEPDSMFDMLYKGGTKNYISIYLISAMEGGIKALEYMIQLKKESKKYSRDDVIKHIMQEALPEIQSNAKGLKGISVEEKSYRTIVECIFESVNEKYNDLAETCEKDVFYVLKNELFNIFFPQVCDVIFNEDNDGLTWSQNSKHDRKKYKEDFSLITDFYLKVFEGIHPEYEIIENYLVKYFDEMTDFVMCFMRGSIFHSLRKCPTDTSSAYQQPGSEFTLPAGMTFTLPSKAKYAFRYYNVSPGWFKFPPGTQFALQDRSVVSLPDNAEFKNEVFYPRQCFVTYDMATRSGSSGAAVFCDLLQMPFMTLFPHRSDISMDTRRSGVQTNRFCTLLKSMSNIFEKIATSN